jgi:hypothetical protein
MAMCHRREEVSRRVLMAGEPMSKFLMWRR